MNTDTKVILIAGISTLFIIGGGVFFITKSTLVVPKEDLISETNIHWHPRLNITIDGKKIELDKNIGIGAIHAPFHTHDGDYKDGIIHMELSGPVQKKGTLLGRFFQIWGKKFDQNCIFDNCNSEKGILKMLVNGKENTAFENYEMKDNDKIEINFDRG